MTTCSGCNGAGTYTDARGTMRCVVCGGKGEWPVREAFARTESIQKGRNAVHLTAQDGDYFPVDGTVPRFTATLCGRAIDHASWRFVQESATCGKCEAIYSAQLDAALAESTTPAGYVAVGGSWAGTYEPECGSVDSARSLYPVREDGRPSVNSRGDAELYAGCCGTTFVGPNPETSHAEYHNDQYSRGRRSDYIAVTADDGEAATFDGEIFRPAEDEVTEWRNVRGSRVATARRYVRDARALRQAGADAASVFRTLAEAGAARRNGWHASIFLGWVEGGTR